jgi:hypothetical protein
MNVYKLIILWLMTVPIAFAGHGQLDLINIVTIDIDKTNIFEAGNFSSPTFTINIDNNHESGYKITAQSANGSQFNLDNPGFDTNKDGHTLEYQLRCSDVTLEDTSVVTATGLQTLTSDPLGTTMLNVPDPAAATNDIVTCTFQILGSENMAELFSGTYKDNVTVIFDHL